MDELYSNQSFSAALQEKLRQRGHATLADEFDDLTASPFGALVGTDAYQQVLAWLQEHDVLPRDNIEMGLPCADLSDPREELVQAVFKERPPVLPDSTATMAAIQYAQMVADWARQWDQVTRGRILLEASASSDSRPVVPETALLSYYLAHFKTDELPGLVARLCRAGELPLDLRASITTATAQQLPNSQLMCTSFCSGILFHLSHSFIHSPFLFFFFFFFFFFFPLFFFFFFFGLFPVRIAELLRTELAKHNVFPASFAGEPSDSTVQALFQEILRAGKTFNKFVRVVGITRRRRYTRGKFWLTIFLPGMRSVGFRQRSAARFTVGH